jgi:tripartite-type tricarboxylate transporter receptor subunit TctC
MGRPFAVAPGVSHERVTVLREAFIKTVKDPAFLRDAERTRMEIFNPSSGEGVQSFIEKVLAAPPAIVRRIAEILS